MSDETSQTLLHLEQWNGGDPAGLDALLSRHLPWIRAHIRRRMGPLLRKKAESCDYLQDVMVEFLRYGPRIQVSAGAQFRALLVRIVESALRDKHDWFTARRRAISRERPLPPDTVLRIDPPRERSETPSVEADNHERQAWLRLGMELVDPGDREVLVLRQWDGLPFPEIGKRLALSEDAARMRYNRAVGRLADDVGRLRRHGLPEIEETNRTAAGENR